MARLRDLKVGMKVQLRGNHRYYPNQTGEVLVTSWCDNQVLVRLEEGKTNYWFHTVQVKIIKDEGETAMKQTKTTKITDPQKYILIDDADISESFTDVTAKGIFGISNEEWAWDQYETSERIKEGKMKLFKIEEVKLEVTEPSIKIVG